MSQKVNVHIRCREDPEKVWYQEGSSISYKKGKSTITFRDFKSIFFKEKNERIYNSCVKESIESYLDKTNVTIFAYGQTGSGKTYTMTGEQDDPGIVQMGLKDIFANELKTAIKISCLEIYNEKIFDLSNNTELKMYTQRGSHIIKNLHIESAESIESASAFLNKCNTNRKVGITEYNSNSSRSHSIIQISYENSTLNFIDLAGSERASRYDSRRTEGSYINKSLLALGTLVNNLLNNKQLGFRDSQLTRILQSSFDGNTQLIALCMISPYKKCIEESLSTLSFAARLSNIVLKGHEVPLEELFCAKIETLSAAEEKHSDHTSVLEEIVDTYIENDSVISELYKSRISFLESTIVKLLAKSPNKTIEAEYLLEKEIYESELKCFGKKN